MRSKVSAALCAAAALYTAWYMHFDKPWTNDGALSTIGLEHRALFTVWGVLTAAALGGAIYLGYTRSGRKRLGLLLLGVSALGMGLTLAFRFEYGAVPDYYLHCAGSLLFSAVTGFAVFLLFLLEGEKLFGALTAVILIGDLICLLVFKETGLIEAAPILAGYIMLSVYNIRREKREAAREAQNA